MFDVMKFYQWRSLLSNRPKYLFISFQFTPCLTDKIIKYLFFLDNNSAIAMGIVQYLQVMLFVFNLTPSTEAQKAITYQNFKFAIDDDVIHNQILEGHVFQSLTVPNAIQCHLKYKDDCLCVSMNYFLLSRENNCELNDANKDMEPAAMKWRQGGNYYELVRSYTVKVR